MSNANLSGGGIGKKKTYAINRKVKKQLLNAGVKDTDLAFEAIQGIGNQPKVGEEAKGGGAAPPASSEAIPYADADYQDYLGTWANNAYIPPKNVASENAFAPLRSIKYSVQARNPTAWQVMTGDKLKALSGRVEEASGKKAVPKVKFVRSGKRWGAIIG